MREPCLLLQQSQHEGKNQLLGTAGAGFASERPLQCGWNAVGHQRVCVNLCLSHLVLLLPVTHKRHPRDQFVPFLLPEDESADPEDYYEQYCNTLETTAGGWVGGVCRQTG